MTKYAVIFIFDPFLKEVLLIHKLKPRWMKGKVNGIGGKTEGEESAISCILRETKEETDLKLKEKELNYLGNMSSPEWLAEVFACIYKGQKSDAKSMEEEKIEWFGVDNLPKNVMSNLYWLIPFAIDKIKNRQVKTFSVKY